MLLGRKSAEEIPHASLRILDAVLAFPEACACLRPTVCLMSMPSVSALTVKLPEGSLSSTSDNRAMFQTIFLFDISGSVQGCRCVIAAMRAFEAVADSSFSHFTTYRAGKPRTLRRDSDQFYGAFLTFFPEALPNKAAETSGKFAFGRFGNLTLFQDCGRK